MEDEVKEAEHDVDCLSSELANVDRFLSTLCLRKLDPIITMTMFTNYFW